MVGAAERAGLDSVWVPDHVLRVFGPVLDPLTALAFLAGSTSRIKLGTGVLVLPYRHPVPLANAASTLDVLSGGRFVLGAGAGWNAGEFEALGMNVRERGRRTGEVLECLQRLWSGEKCSFSGRYYSFEDAKIGARPHTPGGPPVLVGGKSEAALERTMRYSEGWMGFGDGPEAIRDVRKSLYRPRGRSRPRPRQPGNRKYPRRECASYGSTGRYRGCSGRDPRAAERSRDHLLRPLALSRDHRDSCLGRRRSST